MATRKTTAKKTTAKANAKARGPKAGSSQRNQTANGIKTTEDLDTITGVANVRTGNGCLVSAGSASCVIAPWQDNGTTRKLAVVGGSLAKLREHLATLRKPEAKLARGVDSHNSPHSAKAVADAKASAPANPAAKSAKAKPTKAAANKAPSRGVDRDYSKGKTEIKANKESWRYYMLTTIQKHTNTAKAKAAHAKSGKFSDNKLDFNWAASQGYIVWAK